MYTEPKWHIWLPQVLITAFAIAAVVAIPLTCGQSAWLAGLAAEDSAARAVSMVDGAAIDGAEREAAGAAIDGQQVVADVEPLQQSVGEGPDNGQLETPLLRQADAEQLERNSGPLQQSVGEGPDNGQLRTPLLGQADAEQLERNFGQRFCHTAKNTYTKWSNGCRNIKGGISYPFRKIMSKIPERPRRWLGKGVSWSINGYFAYDMYKSLRISERNNRF